MAEQAVNNSAYHTATDEIETRWFLSCRQEPLEGLRVGSSEVWSRGIEPATRGLGISSGPISADLTPQETTNQRSPDMGIDGADSSCPDSSVVADEDDRTYCSLINSDFIGVAKVPDDWAAPMP